MAGEVETAVAEELEHAPSWLRTQAVNLARQLDEGVVPGEKGGEPAPAWRAAVSKQLTALVVYAKSQTTMSTGSVLDELTARRTGARVADPSNPGGSAIVGQPGVGSDRVVRGRRNVPRRGAEADAG